MRSTTRANRRQAPNTLALEIN